MNSLNFRNPYINNTNITRWIMTFINTGKSYDNEPKKHEASFCYVSKSERSNLKLGVSEKCLAKSRC